MYVCTYIQMDDPIVNISDTTNNDMKDVEGKVESPVCS